LYEVNLPSSLEYASKKLSIRKVRDFAMDIWVRKVCGAFKKRAPGLDSVMFFPLGDAIIKEIQRGFLS